LKRMWSNWQNSDSPETSRLWENQIGSEDNRINTHVTKIAISNDCRVGSRARPVTAQPVMGGLVTEK